MRINLHNVKQVYSGKQGKCCCGCSGTHTHHSIHRELAPEYVRNDDDDFSHAKDRVVKQVVKKIERLANEGMLAGGTVGQIEFVQPDFVSAETDNGRVYVAYFAEPDPDFAQQHRHLDKDELRRRAKEEKQLDEDRAKEAWCLSAQLHW